MILLPKATQVYIHRERYHLARVALEWVLYGAGIVALVILTVRVFTP